MLYVCRNTSCLLIYFMYIKMQAGKGNDRIKNIDDYSGLHYGQSQHSNAFFLLCTFCDAVFFYYYYWFFILYWISMHVCILVRMYYIW